MVFFNHATRQMTAKIVYYGPGLCGKTTNLNTIYGKTSQKARGEMVSLNTETDRTLFFDLLPMDVGMVGGFKTKLQLYTVPGQVFYNSTRKLVLKGVDGIVFVVDSQNAMLEACKESYQNLEENLRELGLNLGDIPMVFQWNKRDLRNVVPVEELEAVFNPKGTPSFQSVAADGTGVFETLRGITKLALFHIKTNVLGEAQAPAPPAAPAAAPPMPQRVPIEALTLSDLPSVTDLLDMEGSASETSAAGSAPLPDEDEDTGFYIEAPTLPEHPGTLDDDISFLMEDESDTPPLAVPELPHVVPAPVAVEARGDAGEALTPFDAGLIEAQPPTAPEVNSVVPAAAVLLTSQVPAPVVAPAPTVPDKPRPKADPLAALAALKVETRRPAPKATASHQQHSIESLMGELTQVGRAGAASVLRLELPGTVDGQEIEVVVQLRSQGSVLAEGRLQRPAPAKGITAKLSVEMKRS